MHSSVIYVCINEALKITREKYLFDEIFVTYLKTALQISVVVGSEW